MEFKFEVNGFFLQCLIWPLFWPWRAVTHIIQGIMEECSSSQDYRDKRDFWEGLTGFFGIFGGFAWCVFAIGLESWFWNLFSLWLYGTIFTMGIRVWWKYKNLAER
jgi:hypothetical protein